MTLEEFKELNKSIGNHWFKEGAMEFFDSKIHDFDEDSGFFITSEDSHIGSSKRLYTIRLANFQTGRVKTVGTFQEFDSITQARTRFKRLILCAD